MRLPKRPGTTRLPKVLVSMQVLRGSVSMNGPRVPASRRDPRVVASTLKAGKVKSKDRVKKERSRASTSGEKRPGTRHAGGARLVLSFDPASNAFVGMIENTTEQMLCAVRVEVHLSTGSELGPTERTDLQPGERTDVALPTAGEVFETWTAHPEVSPCTGL